MTFTLGEVTALIGSLALLLGSLTGVAAWRNSKIDRRKSVFDQLQDLNDKYTAEIKRVDAEREDLEIKLRNASIAALQREEGLREQMSAIQRKAEERERMLQEEINRLQRVIAAQAEKIALLERQQRGGNA